MVKIAQVTSTQALPGTTGTPQLSGAPYAQIGQAAEQFGLTVQDIALGVEERDANARIADIEQQFRKQSREFYMDAQANRQGKAALADDAAGTKSVYEDYNEFSAKTSGDMVNTINPKYRDAAQAKLNQVGESYKNSISSFQAVQHQAYRNDTVIALGNTISTELSNDMEVSGAGVDSILFSIGEMQTAMDENSGGADTTVQMTAYGHRATKDAIIAKANTWPRQALDMLDDDRLDAYLTEEDRNSLRKLAEDKRIEKDSNALAASVSLLPYEEQKKVINEREGDPKVKAKANSVVDTNESNKVKEQNRRQFNMMNDIHDRLFVQGEAITEADIDAIPANQLDFGQKEQVKGWINSLKTGDGKPGQLDDFARIAAWESARSKVFSQEWDADDVSAAWKRGEIDIRDAKSLITFAETFASSPSIYRNVDEFFQAEYPNVYKKADKRAAVMQGVMQDLLNEMAGAGERGEIARPPDRATIQKFITDQAQGVVKSSWYLPDPEGVDIAQETIPFIDDPLVGVERTDQPSLLNRDVARYLAQGYTQAKPVVGLDMVEVGPASEPGFVLVDPRDGDGIRKVPVNDWLLMQADANRGE